MDVIDKNEKANEASPDKIIDFNSASGKSEKIVTSGMGV